MFNLFANINDSEAAIIAIPKAMLLQILAPLPLPKSPAWNIFFPIILNKGSAFSNAFFDPPTIIFKVAFWAPITPPLTGASIISIPISEAFFPISIEVWISIVEQSISKQFFDTLFIIPLSPK